MYASTILTKVLDQKEPNWGTKVPWNCFQCADARRTWWPWSGQQMSPATEAIWWINTFSCIPHDHYVMIWTKGVAPLFYYSLLISASPNPPGTYTYIRTKHTRTPMFTMHKRYICSSLFATILITSCRSLLLLTLPGHTYTYVLNIHKQQCSQCTSDNICFSLRILTTSTWPPRDAMYKGVSP